MARNSSRARLEALHAAAQEVHALALVLAQPTLEVFFQPEREVGDPAERRPEIVRRDVGELIELPGAAFERGGEGRPLLLEALALDLGSLQGKAKALLGVEPGARSRLFGRARVDLGGRLGLGGWCLLDWLGRHGGVGLKTERAKNRIGAKCRQDPLSRSGHAHRERIESATRSPAAWCEGAWR